MYYSNSKWFVPLGILPFLLLKFSKTALEGVDNLFHQQTGLFQLFKSPKNEYLCKQINGTKEREVDVKTHPSTLKRLYVLTSTFALSMTISLPKGEEGLLNSLQSSVNSSVRQLASHLKKTVAILDGKTYPLFPSNPPSSTTTISTLGNILQQNVTLLTPSLGNICSEEHKKGEIGRVIQVAGNIVGVTVGSAEGSLESMLESLAGDLCTTLRTRLSLLCEIEDSSPELPSRIVARVPVSRSAPDARNSVLLCDYVTSYESVRESEERFQELLALALPKSGNVDGIETGVILREDNSKVLVQQLPPQQTSKDQPQKKTNDNVLDTTKHQNNQQNNQQKSFFLPLMVAVVVAIVGVLIFVMQKK